MHDSPLCSAALAGFAALASAPHSPDPAVPSLPDNGAVAVALPLRGITVDGDLDDWPESRRFAIRWQPSGEERPPTADLQASFRVGYDAPVGRLYVAVEVVDDEHIVTGSTWDSCDSHLLYVDVTHSVRGSGSRVYAAHGSNRELLGGRESWDPAVAAATWDGCQVAVARSGRRTVYEWQVDIGEAARPGRTVGFDHFVRDVDAGDSAEGGSMVFWGPYTGKSRGASRCGDLLLLPEGASLGTLRGTMGWASPREIAAPRRVRVVSSEDPERWVHVDADEGGHYELRLPPGMYTVSCPFQTVGEYEPEFERLDQSIAVDVVVSAARETVAPPLRLKVVAPPSIPDPGQGILLDFRPQRRADLDRFVREWMDYYRIPGVSLAVVVDREIAHHGVYGVKNHLTKNRVTPDTVFEAASITKPVFAFLANSLAERGWLDLDRPLSEYLDRPEMAIDPRAKQITARHCLTHRTGWPNWRRSTGGELRTRFVPGTRHGYSGEGFEYLGEVVAEIYNERQEPGGDRLSLEQILRREVCDPLGFGERTFFSDSPGLRELASHGHFTTRTTAAYLPKEIGVAHSMHTEARSFAKFMIELMRRQHLVPATYDAMFRPSGGHDTDRKYVGVDWPRYFGLGFLLMDTPHGWSVGHGGDNGDFKCEMECYPDLGVGFVVFTNSDHGALLAHRLREYLVGTGD